MSRPLAAADFEGLRAAFDHDLKTPLTVIIGYAELLLLRPDDEQTRDEAPRRILEAAERLSLELEALAIRLARIAPYNPEHTVVWLPREQATPPPADTGWTRRPQRVRDDLHQTTDQIPSDRALGRGPL